LETTKYKEYLLRSLPERESAEMDIRVISDESLEEMLSRAEDELIEEYLEGTLTQNDAKLFRENFLVSDERKTHLRHIRLLKKHAREEESKRNSKQDHTPRSETFFQKIYRYLKSNLRPVTAALSILILGLAIVIGWQLFYRNSQIGKHNSTGNELAELNREDLDDLSKFQKLSVESLSPGIYRDGDGIKNLPTAGLTDRILFRLALPAQADSAHPFTANLVREDAMISSLDGLRSYDNQGGKELRIILPLSLLRKGDYKINIKQENGAAFSYPFIVR
jgi:hypothetical protein